MALNITPGGTDQQLKAARVRQSYNDRVDKIRLDTTLTQEGKRRQLAAAYLDVVASVGELKQTEADIAAATQADLRKRVLGLTSTEARDGQSVYSYRDANERVSELPDKDAAMALYRTAVLGSDTLLTRAILGAAILKGWGDVVEEYADDNPAIAADVQALWQAGGGDKASRMAARLGSAMSYNVTRPAELQGYSDSALATLAGR